MDTTHRVADQGRVVRLGAVNYLNVRPLVYGLEQRHDVSLRFDVPSECARLLDAGEIDLGMVPSITHLGRPGDRIVPGVCIGSNGPVASVAIFTTRPMSAVRTIALDTSSRTSAMLVRILCRRVFQISPTFMPYAPDLRTMLATADAALLIGDPALFLGDLPAGVEKIDLGQAWAEMTGLPFVWAFWAGRPDAASAAVVETLQAAARAGRSRLDDVARAYTGDVPAHTALACRYLRENLMFDLTPRALDGLRTFYREAATLGLTGPVIDPAFFPAVRYN